MDAGADLVEMALEARAAAILTNDLYIEADANRFLDDEDVCRALVEAGVADIDRENLSASLTEAGEERIVEIAEKLVARVEGNKAQPDFTGAPAYRLELALCFDALTCTRTLVVPAHVTFEDLHTMVQAAVGWQNYHLYDFSLVRDGRECYVSWPDYETGADPREASRLVGEELDGWVNSATAYLDEWLPEGGHLLYSYDYGDGWEMDLTIQDVTTMEGPDPACLAGVGDAPPEDVGGEWGFEEFLRIVADEDDPEHGEMLSWGEEQGFEHFDLSNTNARLADWKEWRRLDGHAMSITAQFAAFGSILFLPPSEQVVDNYELERSKKIFMSFGTKLLTEGLSAATLERHLTNAELFCREYLSRQPDERIDDAVDLVDEFFLMWLPKLSPGMGAGELKQFTVSVKRLLRHMVYLEWVEMDDWREVCDLIKERLPLWTEVMRGTGK